MKLKNSFEDTLFVNLACGDTFIKSKNWLNFDYKKKDNIKKTNLLKRLPISDNFANVVYCSHFIEHIPENKVGTFLIECKRVLKNEGIIRLVMPDFRKMVEEYLIQRNLANDKKASFMMTSIIDQFVRVVPGGKLKLTFEEVEKNNNYELKDYIYKRTGYNFKNLTSKNQDLPKINFINDKIKSFLFKKYCVLISSFLPKEFKDQNFSLADLGEKHAWIYDKDSIKNLLELAGFKNVIEVSESSSLVSNFPFKELDLNEDNVPKKGFDSMFIEAVK